MIRSEFVKMFFNFYLSFRMKYRSNLNLTDISMASDFKVVYTSGLLKVGLVVGKMMSFA